MDTVQDKDTPAPILTRTKKGTGTTPKEGAGIPAQTPPAPALYILD